MNMRMGPLSPASDLSGPFYLWLLMLLTTAPVSESGSVLVWQHLGSRSHMISMRPLINKLVEKGHSVVNVAPAKVAENSDRLRTIETGNDFAKIFNWGDNVFRADHLEMLRNSITPGKLRGALNRTFHLDGVQQLLRDRPHFDLVIVSVASADLGLYLAKEMFNAPIVLFGPGLMFPLFYEALGNPTNPAYIPMDVSSLSPSMNLGQRIRNTLAYLSINFLYRHVLNDFLYDHDIQNLMKLDEKPDLNEILSHVDLMLVNTHPIFEQARPLAPNTIFVGGLHIDREASKENLPKDLKKFVDEAEHGVVIVSFGSITKASHMPEETRLAMLKVFSRLKQRVIFKWEGDEMPDKPDNLMITNWLPQQDMLSHENVRLFVTHGGLLSAQEALFHGKPMVVIPGFGDQFANAERVVRIGYGATIGWTQLTEQNFEKVVHSVLDDPSKASLASHHGYVMHDELLAPLDKAVYYIEHVMKHGSEHLRPSSIDLGLIQYLLLDVIVFVMFLMALVFGGFYLLFKCLLKGHFGSGQDKKKRKKRV